MTHHPFRRIIHFSPLLFTLVFFFSNCKGKQKSVNTPKANPAVIVDVMVAQLQPISNIIEASGTVIAGEYVELRPEVSGKLTYLNLMEGKFIGAGTIIARVNDADLRAQILRSKVQLDLAQKTVDRYKQLLDINGINQADYDIALNQVNTLNADIVYTQSLIDKTVIKAPFSGVVGLRQVSPGAYVTPATIIATLQKTSTVKIDFTLPETYSSEISNGTEIEVEFDASTKKRERAVIIATEPGANTDTRNLKVRAILKGTITNPGAFVKVYIDAGKGKTAIKIPTNCIIPEDKNNQVIVVKDGKANFVNVQTGIREDKTVEIVSGVNVGDSVVVTGVLFARPKSKLNIRSVKTMSELTTDVAAE